jgi:hypothetical protein
LSKIGQSKQVARHFFSQYISNPTKLDSSTSKRQRFDDDDYARGAKKKKLIYKTAPNVVDRGIGIQSILTLEIRFAVLNLFTRHKAMSDNEYEMGMRMRRERIRVYPGHDSDVKQLKASLCMYANQNLPNLYTDLAALPGFGELDKELIGLMLSRCFFAVYGGLVHSRLFMRNEWFRQLPGGIQFSFKKMEQLNSKLPEVVRGLLCAVNCLELKEMETALLIPCISMLTLHGLIQFYFSLTK